MRAIVYHCSSLLCAFIAGLDVSALMPNPTYHADWFNVILGVLYALVFSLAAREAAINQEAR